MNNNRSISNKSIFGEYEHPEDRVTAALLHIFKIGGPEIMGFVFDDFDINLEAEVNTQVKKNGGKSRREGSSERLSISPSTLIRGFNMYLKLWVTQYR